MLNLKSLFSESYDIAENLNFTIHSLATDIAEIELQKRNVLIAALSSQVLELLDKIDEIKIELGNKGISESDVDKCRQNLADNFIKEPNSISWYIDAYSESFLADIDAPILRLTICEELIKQAGIVKNITVPKLWKNIVHNNGLIKDSYDA